MSKVKILTIMVISLGLLNLGLLVFSFFMKPPHPPEGGPKAIVIEKLHFTPEQSKEYVKLIANHEDEVMRLNTEIAQNKIDLYHLLVSDYTAQEKDTIVTKIGKLNMQIEKINFKHFQDIKTICTDEQLVYFDAFAEEIQDIFRLGPPPHRP